MSHLSSMKSRVFCEARQGFYARVALRILMISSKRVMIHFISVAFLMMQVWSVSPEASLEQALRLPKADYHTRAGGFAYGYRRHSFKASEKDVIFLGYRFTSNANVQKECRDRLNVILFEASPTSGQPRYVVHEFTHGSHYLQFDQRSNIIFIESGIRSFHRSAHYRMLLYNSNPRCKKLIGVSQPFVPRSPHGLILPIADREYANSDALVWNKYVLKPITDDQHKSFISKGKLPYQRTVWRYEEADFPDTPGPSGVDPSTISAIPKEPRLYPVIPKKSEQSKKSRLSHYLPNWLVKRTRQ